jgi:hypothetical protein
VIAPKRQSLAGGLWPTYDNVRVLFYSTTFDDSYNVVFDYMDSEVFLVRLSEVLFLLNCDYWAEPDFFEAESETPSTREKVDQRVLVGGLLHVFLKLRICAAFNGASVTPGRSVRQRGNSYASAVITYAPGRS